ncbi:probable ATP-dependent RNA helicase DDX49 isoform X3 [Peromyscus leucopus]|uniref:probable ATP-dependent RNA helicase DDX49 isoform X3 n=1 Tax=Peromyscus leucopus TaxID=10041 RepID=UPI001884EE37|nr:probable ATP-dependent RNA helicase DDX49 isoform X3 [Peromyscus leucopus]
MSAAGVEAAHAGATRLHPGNPGGELAYQIAEQFRVLGKPLGLKDCIIVGGMDMVAQALELSRKPHVVIATPGRLADHLRSSNTFNMKKIRFLVMDEADRLLEQGCTDFTADLETILASVPARRQTLLFSATLTDTLKELQGLATNQPFFWEAQAPVRTVEQLDQHYLLVPEKVKDAYLVHLVQTFQDQLEDCSIIIFTSTCRTCQILCMMLRKFNFPTVSLHSMMKQKERFAALAKFKSSVYRILIATDVASRGLDIPTVQVVINHNTPGLPKIYIHRVGRTARAGRQGRAITLVTQYDIHLLHAIEEQIKKQLEELAVEEAEVLNILTQVNVVRRECEIKLEASHFDEKKEINKRKQLILEGKVDRGGEGPVGRARRGGVASKGGLGLGRATLGSFPAPAFLSRSLPQDPDLEAKRKAELAKIKQQNRRFKEKVGQTLRQRQKAGSARRGAGPRGPQ